MPHFLDHLAPDESEHRLDTSDYVDPSSPAHKAPSTSKEAAHAHHPIPGAPGSEHTGSDHHIAGHGQGHKSAVDAALAAADKEEIEQKDAAKAQRAGVAAKAEELVRRERK
ncbi:hypothetical protein HDV00_008353 [Rhizophlyctis rosea]|nr:hypothetical protein HDV00_008353 [Rhizophlyctis rosea]